MAKITYLFGVGASANCLPVIKNFADSIDNVIKHLSEIELSCNKTDIDSLIEDLIWLRDNSKENATIDTFARKLFLNRRNNHREYLRFKVILTTYFSIEQICSHIDDRYDTLLASIVDDQSKIPDDISFISWNYDLQFELAYRNYVKSRFRQIEHIRQDILEVFDKSHTAINPKLIKLNGTAAFYDFENYQYNFMCDDYSNENEIIKVIKNYNWAKTHYDTVAETLLSYAWEEASDIFCTKTEHLTFNDALKYNKDTNILVVIGYSFPFFNRKIDRTILHSMIDNNALRKIYIQDPKQTSGIKERLTAIIGEGKLSSYDVKIVPINDCETFYIPYEL